MATTTCGGPTLLDGATVTLLRDEDRLSGHYGQFYWLHRVNGTTVAKGVLHTWDRGLAMDIAHTVAKDRNARFLDWARP